MGEVIEQYKRVNNDSSMKSRQNSNICNKSNKTRSSIGIPSDLDGE